MKSQDPKSKVNVNVLQAKYAKKNDTVEGKSNQSLLLTDPESTTLGQPAQRFLKLNSETMYSKSCGTTIQIYDSEIIIVCVGRPSGRDKEAS